MNGYGLRVVIAGGGVAGLETLLEISEQTPWWPPVKIVGRHLAPYLASYASGTDSG